MSHSDFRKQDNFAVSELPTLQDLLKSCDEDLLMRVVWNEHVMRDWGMRESLLKQRNSFYNRIRSALAAMKTLSVKRKKGRNRIILPAETFILREGQTVIERRCGARLLFSVDVCIAETMLHSKGKANTDSINLPARSYSLDPWEVVLASRVCLRGSWCTYERYLVLASAFWEMTFFGFAYDKVMAGQMCAKAKQLLESPAKKKHDGEGQSLAASHYQNERKDLFGLAVSCPLEREYRERLIAWVDGLNREAELDLCKRFIQIVR